MRAMRFPLFLMFAILVPAGAPRAQDADPTAKLLQTLTELRGQLEWPGTDVAAAAAALGDAEAAYRFVRDGVVFADYRGSWGGCGGDAAHARGQPRG